VLELGKKVGGVTFGSEGELGWENQWCAKHGLSRGKVGGVMRGGTIGKENPGQVCNPIW
jgi:hypothetical protein